MQFLRIRDESPDVSTNSLNSSIFNGEFWKVSRHIRALKLDKGEKIKRNEAVYSFFFERTRRGSNEGRNLRGWKCTTEKKISKKRYHYRQKYMSEKINFIKEIIYFQYIHVFSYKLLIIIKLNFNQRNIYQFSIYFSYILNSIFLRLPYLEDFISSRKSFSNLAFDQSNEIRFSGYYSRNSSV